MQIAPRAKWWLIVTRELHYDADATMAVPEPHRKQLLDLISFERYLDYWQVISSRLYVRLNETCSLAIASRALSNTDNKLNNASINYLKMLKKHRGPCVWEPWPSLTLLEQIYLLVFNLAQQRTRVKIWDPLPQSRYANIASNTIICPFCPV